jgi:hypothetical protein
MFDRTASAGRSAAVEGGAPSVARSLGFTLLAAAAAGTAGFIVPLPRWAGPSLSVLVFVAVCFFLECASIRSTFAFAVLIACVPIAALTAGMATRAPLVESFVSSFAAYLGQKGLLVVYLAGPMMTGAIVHGLLWRLRSMRAQARDSRLEGP